MKRRSLKLARTLLPFLFVLLIVVFGHSIRTTLANGGSLMDGVVNTFHNSFTKEFLVGVAVYAACTLAVVVLAIIFMKKFPRMKMGLPQPKTKTTKH